MIKNYLLEILLICVILVQISWGRPTTIELLKSQDLCLQNSRYGDMELKEKDLLLSPSDQLLEFALNAIRQLSEEYVKQAKIISEQLLTNDELLSSEEGDVLELRKNLTEFKEKYSLCDGLVELFELVELYSNTTSYYFELNEAELNAGEKLILKLLRQYGSDELDDEAIKMLNEFVLKFNKKFEDLTDDLAKDESNVGRNMVKWFENFKKAQNMDDKVVAFDAFFSLFEEELQTSESPATV